MAEKTDKDDHAEKAKKATSEESKQETKKEIKTLYRPKDDRMVAGVVAGIARYVGVDVALARIVALLLFLLSPGQFLIVYIVAAIVIPEKDIKADDKDPRDSGRLFGWLLIAGGLYMLAVSVFKFSVPNDMVWGLALIALGAYLLRRRG